MLNNDELNKKVVEFLLKYDKYRTTYDTMVQGFDYDEDSISIFNLIYEYYQDSYDNLESGGYSDILSMQMFSAIDALPNDKNPYYKLADDIEKNYGLDRDIIEVGAGLFPALSYEIAKRQMKINKGTITAYDPWLMPDKLEGIKLVRNKFKKSTPIKEGSLIIGNRPCDGTISAITTANKNNAEFYINLCGCNHASLEYRIKYRGLDERSIWENYIREIAASTLPDGFKIEEDVFINPASKKDKSMIIKTKKK